MYCIHCGEQVVASANFCGACGTKVIRQDERGQRSESTVPVPSAPDKSETTADPATGNMPPVPPAASSSTPLDLGMNPRGVDGFAREPHGQASPGVEGTESEKPAREPPVSTGFNEAARRGDAPDPEQPENGSTASSPPTTIDEKTSLSDSEGQRSRGPVAKPIRVSSTAHPSDSSGTGRKKSDLGEWTEALDAGVLRAQRVIRAKVEQRSEPSVPVSPATESSESARESEVSTGFNKAARRADVPDPEQPVNGSTELERLWATKSDGALEDAAQDIASYTEEGQRIIRAELQRRSAQTNWAAATVDPPAPPTTFDPANSASRRDNGMAWMLLPFKRYAEFSGRSRRKEFWMFSLFQVLVLVTLTIVSSFDASMYEPALGVIILYMLATTIPGLAVSVRRLHDQDKSGWFLLLILIPLAGGLIIFVFNVVDGTYGPNMFGPDPKGRQARPEADLRVDDPLSIW